jgi:hypothetical protein
MFCMGMTRGYDTWSLTLREEHRLRVLRGMFGGKREKEVRGGWRKMYNEELQSLHFSTFHRG